MAGSVEDIDEPMEEEVPKILSNEISDVLPFFANMLDIKSFMKLAMTSKEMYNRCMEDKRISIKIKEEDTLFAENKNGGAEFSLISSIVKKEHVEKYLAKLSILNCNLSIDEVTIDTDEGTQMQDNFMIAVHNHLELLGVKSVDCLNIQGQVTASERIVPLLKTFNVQSVYMVDCDVPDDVARSLLELNLFSFDFNGPFAAHLILDANLDVQKIRIKEMTGCTKNIFLSILWKIQTGPLLSLTIDCDEIDFEDYVSLDFYHNDPLPDERPIVFRKISSVEPFVEFFFLHWHGGLSHCRPVHFDFVITKCEPENFPRSLKNKEIVYKALAEKKTIDCSWTHFESYFEDNYTIFNSSEELPEERPLVFKEKKNHSFVFFKEDNTLEQVAWSSRGDVSYTTFDLENKWPLACENPSLARFVFNAILESNNSTPDFIYSNTENTDSFFEKYKRLPFDYSGPLPEDRPLLFEIPTEFRGIEHEGAIVVLRGNSLAKCVWRSRNESTSFVIDKCPAFWAPLVTVSTKEILKTLLMNIPFVRDIIYRIDLKLFRDALDEFTTIFFKDYDPRQHDRPLVLIKKKMNKESEEDERLLVQDFQITKCQWKDGQASFTKANPWEFPSALKKAFAKERHETFRRPLEMTREQLNAMFRNYPHLPIDFGGPLPEARPIVFENPGEEHGLVVHEDGTFFFYELRSRVTAVDFCPSWRMPSALITTYVLREILLQHPRDVKLNFHLKKEIFLSAFEGIQTINYDFSGPLPKERPLVVVKSKEMVEKRWFFFHGEAKECEWSNGRVTITTAEKKDSPLCLKKHFINKFLKRCCTGLGIQYEFEEMGADCLFSCIDDLPSIPHNHWGPLPDVRPLVFVRNGETKSRILLTSKGNVVKCEKKEEDGLDVDICPKAEKPSILMTGDDIEIIIEEEEPETEIIHRMELTTFLSGFSRYKKIPFDFSGPLPDKRPLIFEKTEKNSDGEIIEKRWSIWYMHMTKCEWKDGYASYSVADPRDFPLEMTKTLLKQHLKSNCKRAKYFLDYDVFLNCLEQFTVSPFDFSGQLPNERPLFFEKTEVKHTSHLCPDEGHGCSHLIHSLWRLDEEERLSFCSWSENEVVFEESKATDGLPPVLKTKEYLKNVLIEKGSTTRWFSHSQWYGNLNDFHACFEDFTRLPFNHDDPLPEERPLVFENNSEEKTSYLFLRDDDMVIECSYSNDCATLCTAPRFPRPNSLRVYFSSK